MFFVDLEVRITWNVSYLIYYRQIAGTLSFETVGSILARIGYL